MFTTESFPSAAEQNLLESSVKAAGMGPGREPQVIPTYPTGWGS